MKSNKTLAALPVFLLLILNNCSEEELPYTFTLINRSGFEIVLTCADCKTIELANDEKKVIKSNDQFSSYVITTSTLKDTLTASYGLPLNQDGNVYTIHSLSNFNWFVTYEEHSFCSDPTRNSIRGLYCSPTNCYRWGFLPDGNFSSSYVNGYPPYKYSNSFISCGANCISTFSGTYTLSDIKLNIILSDGQVKRYMFKTTIGYFSSDPSRIHSSLMELTPIDEPCSSGTYKLQGQPL